MSKITRQDTNGVKPLLDTGELGYDNYPAGGDAGRVYVGTGSANIAQAKKSEVDALNTATYKKNELDAGQLDNRYYTETEIDAKLAEQNDASEISYDGTISELVATNVQDAIDEVEGRIDDVEGRLDVAEGVVAETNLLRADKYLAAQNIANMDYTDGNLTKIQYTTATNVDYEVFGYVSGNLSTIHHYVGSVLKGTTTLSYTDGNLVSAIFIGV